MVKVYYGVELEFLINYDDYLNFVSEIKELPYVSRTRDASILPKQHYEDIELQISGYIKKYDYNIIKKIKKVFKILDKYDWDINSSCACHVHVSCGHKTLALFKYVYSDFYEIVQRRHRDYALYIGAEEVVETLKLYKLLDAGLETEYNNLLKRLNTRHTDKNFYCFPYKNPVVSHHSLISVSEYSTIEFRMFPMSKNFEYYEIILKCLNKFLNFCLSQSVYTDEIVTDINSFECKP